MTDREIDKAIDVLRNVLTSTRTLSRRAFLQHLSRAATGSALLGTFARALTNTAHAESPVTTIGWGGAWQDAMETAFFKPWTKNSGIPVQYITPYDFSKLMAMHKAGQQQVDIVEAGSLDTPRMIKYQMNAPLDFNIIDRSALSPGQLKYENSIGAITLSTVFVYSKAKWPGEDAPQTWADFWNVKKFPGPRSMQRRVYPMLEAALMADGVPADPRKMYPLDVDRAFKKLDEIRPHVVTWWSSGSEPQQLIRDKEVDLSVIWNGRASDSILNQKVPYQQVWNQALYNGDIEAWFLMKNGPNPQAGMKLLDFVGRAEPQAAFARALYYGPTNLKAYEFIDAELAKHLPSYPANEKVSLLINYNWWLENIDDLTRRFEQWIQS
jgi:putative spermidine/putrescine transport system substrate-binding protein